MAERPRPLAVALGCVLLAVLVGGVWVLARTPVPAASAPPGVGSDGEGVPHTHVGMPGMTSGSGAVVPVGGLRPAAGGYSFVAGDTMFTPGTGRTFTFHITGPDGRPVTRFAVVNDKPLHLILIRADLTDFAHVHPTMAADGTWSVRLTLPEPGPYRAYADFTALGARGAAVAAVLAIDLRATGPVPWRPRPLPPADPVSTVDGFTVTYQGTPTVGTVEPFLFRVTREGRPVSLEHYLGTYGHLVVLRQRDLGYLHIHPEPALADGMVKFWLAAPGAGPYRMFLNFQVAGVVHTAQWTLNV